jgi:hypothetical protein
LWAAAQFQVKADFTLLHRPMMVHAEKWLEQEREPFEQWLVGFD